MKLIINEITLEELTQLVKNLMEAQAKDLANEAKADLERVQRDLSAAKKAKGKAEQESPEKEQSPEKTTKKTGKKPGRKPGRKPASVTKEEKVAVETPAPEPVVEPAVPEEPVVDITFEPAVADSSAPAEVAYSEPTGVDYIPDHLPLGDAVKKCHKANEHYRETKKKKRAKREKTVERPVLKGKRASKSGIVCRHIDGTIRVMEDIGVASVNCLSSVSYIKKLMNTGKCNKFGWSFWKGGAE